MTSATKISEKSVEKLLRKWRFSNIIFRHFGPQISKCLKAARMFSFEVRRNQSTPIRVKLNFLQNSHLGFLIFLDFDPKNSKFQFFSKIIAYKIQNLQVIQKTGMYVIERRTNNTHTKFQRNILVFGCAMAKTPGKGDDVTFLKCIFWHF